MDLIPATGAHATLRMTTDELRRAFLADGLFLPGALVLKYWETDRTVFGGAVPTDDPLVLAAPRELASPAFCDRRELGIINTGGAGTVIVDGQAFPTAYLDGLYVGRGAQDIRLASADAARPAQFYLLSYPAHAAYPTTFIAFREANGTVLGSPATANVRVLHKLIHPGGVKSCQLVMGYTLVQPGSVWNTMPPHTHLRRSEVYLYFNVPAESTVFHFMGETLETRHLLVHDREAVLSPPWSLHSGAGTGHYGFIWGMGGENQEFADMDMIKPSELR